MSAIGLQQVDVLGRDFWVGVFIFLLSSVHLYMLLRHFRRYRRTWFGWLTLSVGEVQLSREAGIAGSLVFFGIALLAMIQSSRVLPDWPAGVLLLTSLAAALGYMERDVRRFKAAHPRRVAAAGAELGYMDHGWWWPAALALAVFSLFAESGSEIQFVLAMAPSLKTSHFVFDGLSRLALARPFKPPAKGDANLAQTWSDWILFLPWLIVSAFGAASFERLSQMVQGSPERAQWPWL
jgi:hypothetical protein